MYIKIRVILITVLFLYFNFISLPNFTVSANEKVKEINVFLWEVTTKETNKTNYFLGTIHIDVKDKYYFPEKVNKSLKKSKTFAMESDLNSVNPFMLAKYLFLPPDKSLKKMLPDKYWKKLVDKMSFFGIANEEYISRLKPWNIFITLQMPTPPPNPANIMDSVLKDMADTESLDIVYLETTTSIFNLLDKIPESEIIKLIKEMLDEPEETQNKVDSIKNAYLNNDLKSIKKYVLDKNLQLQYPHTFNTLFTIRNKNWLPSIEEMINNGDAFITCGLGHLIGKNGILGILQKKGYKIKRIKKD